MKATADYNRDNNIPLLTSTNQNSYKYLLELTTLTNLTYANPPRHSYTQRKIVVFPYAIWNWRDKRRAGCCENFYQNSVRKCTRWSQAPSSHSVFEKFRTTKNSNTVKKQPTAKATMKINIWDRTLAENFDVKKNLKSVINGLHFMLHNDVVVVLMNCLLQVLHLKIQFRVGKGSSGKNKSLQNHNVSTVQIIWQSPDGLQ